VATVFFSLTLSLSAARTGDDILHTTGVKAGVVVHLGCGDGTLTAELAAADRMLVHGLGRDAATVEKARAHLRSLGLYGMKATVELFSGSSLPYMDNMVKLLVVGDAGTVSQEEMMRVLSPLGVLLRKDGTKVVKAWPENIDEWTHFLHSPGNNAIARDDLVGPPRRLQWVADSEMARSHDQLASTSAMVSARGRIFSIIDEAPIASVAINAKWTLVARDAFSGVLLWKRPIGLWEDHMRGFRSGPTELPRRLVAVGDRVYVTLGYDQPITALDAATGETLMTYPQTENAVEMIVHDDRLFAVVAKQPSPSKLPKKELSTWMHWRIRLDERPEKFLIALNPQDGKILWTKDDADVTYILPTTLAAEGSRVFFQNREQVVALQAENGNKLWASNRASSPQRPSWSAPTLVVADGILISADRNVTQPYNTKLPSGCNWFIDSQGGVAPVGKMIAFESATGKQLWDAPCKESYNAAVDILVADGVVWSGDLVKKTAPGMTAGLDLKTGKEVRTRNPDQDSIHIGMSHHRCYRNKGTEKYLLLGRDGIEFLDLKTGEIEANPWTRGVCQYGVMPCNGLTYVPSHSCACHADILINGFNAIAPAASEPAPAAVERLVEGPAYGRLTGAVPPAESWPTYRHDPTRSGCASTDVSATLTTEWTAKLPGKKLSSPTVANGRIYVSCIDQNLICAVDIATGRICWSFTAGGSVDSPPTIYGNAVLFGCADGWVYSLDSDTGELAWKCLAAPDARLIVAYDRLESTHPLHGTVLVQNETLYAVAGRSPYLNGGLRLIRLNPLTGEELSTTVITKDCRRGILTSDGYNIFLNQKSFDLDGVEQADAKIDHLFCPTGLLNDQWWHRTYWLYGSSMNSGQGYGAWPRMAQQKPAGRIMTIDGEQIYSYGRYGQLNKMGAHVGLGNVHYQIYSTRIKPPSPEAKPTSKKRRGKNRGNQVKADWTNKLPVLVRAMVLCKQTLFVAGPPDYFEPAAPSASNDPYIPGPAQSLQKQQESFAGNHGGKLIAISREDGKPVASYELDAMPVWDSLIAAEKRLFFTTADGALVSMKSE
jgi:outer membrane protein assembly factor BamB